MRPYAGVDYNLTFCRLQDMYHGQSYARVDFIPHSGTKNSASVFPYKKCLKSPFFPLNYQLLVMVSLISFVFI
jgi:hypothetical protein